jgi:hypothetical protein
VIKARLITAIGLVILAASTASAYDLGQHQWRHRLLFLVAPQGDDPDLSVQRQYLAQRQDAVRDRDLRLFQLFSDHGSVDGRPLSPDSVRQLRQDLGLDPDDRSLVLVGKDGGVKRRADLSTELSDVFRQIDAMPMRRAEMRSKTKAGIEVTSP